MKRFNTLTLFIVLVAIVLVGAFVVKEGFSNLPPTTISYLKVAGQKCSTKCADGGICKNGKCVARVPQNQLCGNKSGQWDFTFCDKGACKRRPNQPISNTALFCVA